MLTQLTDDSERDSVLCIQLRRQNVELKRRSQQLIDKMQIVDIDIDDVDSATDDITDDDSSDSLNNKILRNYQYIAV